jgi:hypothetical protein
VNYDQPRQHSQGGWHYTRRNDDNIWALGYCRDHTPHPTEDGARECYAAFLLNERLGLNGRRELAYYPCQIDGCRTLANSVVSIDGWPASYHLCDEHRTKEQVVALYGRYAGDSVHH